MHATHPKTHSFLQWL